jgi:predicted 2-oxoglutarate/Fe(II)-dependent dioxygenase YbiX
MRKELLADDGDVFVVHDFLTPDECWHFVARSEAAGYGDAPINAGLAQQVVRKDVRNNDRVMIDDSDLARTLWERARPVVPDRLGRWAAVGLNERLRFYRYDPGQRFVWHRDGAFYRDNGEQSHLTFMVYLNGDFEGGATEFNLRRMGMIQLDDPLLTVTPTAGKLLVFRHELLHQGAPVTTGRKYVLRTDVMYRAAP